MNEGARIANQRMYERGINDRLDRIIELLESFKVPVVLHVTNPLAHVVRKGVPFIPDNIEVEYNINDIPDLPDDIEALNDTRE